MGLLYGLLGNSSEIDPQKIQSEFTRMLVDKQGLTGRKIEYHSLPYQAITHFSIETPGHFDLDAELKIRLSGSPTPIQKTFNKCLSVYEHQSVPAKCLLR